MIKFLLPIDVQILHDRREFAGVSKVESRYAWQKKDLDLSILSAE